jgi:hypothetical protein
MARLMTLPKDETTIAPSLAHVMLDEQEDVDETTVCPLAEYQDCCHKLSDQVL